MFARSLVVAPLLLASVALAIPVVAAEADGSWSVPRTAYGHPDLQGVWANNNATPLQRPEVLGDRERLTDAELASLKARAEELFAVDAGDAAFGDSIFNAALSEAETFTSRDGGTGNYNQFWLVERDWDHRTSLIVDPPNGRLPPLTEEGRERRQRTLAARARPAEGPEDRSLGERCITFGVPRLGAGYNSYYQIVQSEDHVVILMEMIHDARIIPIDGRPPLDDEIRLWHGDSRGRWEGDTLVIETRNFSDDGGYRGASGGLTLVERLTRTGPDELLYETTLEDPRTWTTPWTAVIPLRRKDEAIFEYACHEGNYGMEGILAGARAQDAPASR
ncbi:MAG: hypothetical protein R3190_02530 [Thermoanaerobaculia bacterium]|nr:hypothetical protein [Thermoanaerobaculia bacterium]